MEHNYNYSVSIKDSELGMIELKFLAGIAAE